MYLGSTDCHVQFRTDVHTEDLEEKEEEEEERRRRRRRGGGGGGGEEERRRREMGLREGPCGMSHMRPEVEGVCGSQPYVPHYHAHIRFAEDAQTTPAEEDTKYHVSKVSRPPSQVLLTLLLNFQMTQVVSREPVMR